AQFGAEFLSLSVPARVRLYVHPAVQDLEKKEARMSRRKSILALASCAAFNGTLAYGSVTPLYPSGTYFDNIPLVPHTAGQLADDPTLANYCTYDIQVVVDSS